MIWNDQPDMINNFRSFTEANMFPFTGLPTESRLNKMLNLGRANTRSLRNINVGPMWLETRQILYKFYKPFNRMLAWLLQDITFDYGFT